MTAFHSQASASPPGLLFRTSSTVPATPRPLPAVPVAMPRAHGTPLSAFSGSRRAASSKSHQQRYLAAKCNHVLMTRLYGQFLFCDECRRPGSSGWLYSCIQDHDVLTMESKLQGHLVPQDALAAMFIDRMSLGRYGPDKRYQKNSFLYEIDQEQMMSYTPVQIAAILAQRDNVHATISHAKEISSLSPDAKPWVPEPGTSCMFKVCQNCHRHGKDKTWVSLNGVLHGDLPPELVTGSSFLHSGGRPVHDIQIVKTLGLRAVPTKRQDIDPDLGSDTTVGSSLYADLEVEELLEEFDADDSLDLDLLYPSYAGDHSSHHFPNLPGSAPAPLRYLHLARLGAGDNYDTTSSTSLAEQKNPADFDPLLPHVDCFHDLNDFATRPPWTPPPTPTVPFPAPDSNRSKAIHLGSCCIPYDGRSPSSLKANVLVRDELFASIPSEKYVATVRDLHGHRTEELPIPYLPEESCDAGLLLPFNAARFERACRTSLPWPNLEEELFLVGGGTVQDLEEDELFVEALPDAIDAVALTEEGAELGIAGMATEQVTSVVSDA